jgi:hypothetical protein
MVVEIKRARKGANITPRMGDTRIAYTVITVQTNE